MKTVKKRIDIHDDAPEDFELEPVEMHAIAEIRETIEKARKRAHNMGHQKIKHDSRNRTDPTRRAEASSDRTDVQRCRHPCKKLMADGNAYWCEECKRIVGFVRLPTKGKTT